MFAYPGGARACTRQVPWYVPCDEPCVSCAINLQHLYMQHLCRLPKAARYTCYILVAQKGTEIALV